MKSWCYMSSHNDNNQRPPFLEGATLEVLVQLWFMLNTIAYSNTNTHNIYITDMVTLPFKPDTYPFKHLLKATGLWQLTTQYGRSSIWFGRGVGCKQRLSVLFHIQHTETQLFSTQSYTFPHTYTHRHTSARTDQCTV